MGINAETFTSHSVCTVQSICSYHHEKLTIKTYLPRLSSFPFNLKGNDDSLGK